MRKPALCSLDACVPSARKLDPGLSRRFYNLVFRQAPVREARHLQSANRHPGFNMVAQVLALKPHQQIEVDGVNASHGSRT